MQYTKQLMLLLFTLFPSLFAPRGVYSTDSSRIIDIGREFSNIVMGGEREFRQVPGIDIELWLKENKKSRNGREEWKEWARKPSQTELEAEAKILAFEGRKKGARKETEKIMMDGEEGRRELLKAFFGNMTPAYLQDSFFKASMYLQEVSDRLACHEQPLPVARIRKSALVVVPLLFAAMIFYFVRRPCVEA